ncbi:hypothetical protein DOM21_14005 [Bacteriovorax stolpii]|uniref:Uncharacterized protein n=1 Tax=Bacteriovorax stolpii TaxID=960 RepID=A0A2K9NPN1_BACTC|nr:hypothetical protein [Bacteriovorax stolpii]AUN97486.1 hypothetical protein C0V70_05045 [Bacteriovorax stolpii]QDK42542.1 hypothetical protein DOM21_14005 [Bacteriovorax stolpii]TDP52664.1 hypothetical protein C8D79_2430 [Bacteriovorax stolpii]
MSENKQGEKGLFELLEERSPDYIANSKQVGNIDTLIYNNEDEHSKFEFLVQDMFLDHFFP